MDPNYPDPERLALGLPTRVKALTNLPGRPPRRYPGEEFLRGPIPLRWLRAAYMLRGSALAVGLALWFKVGVSDRTTVILSAGLREKFGLRRHAAKRGLNALEDARLVSVDRKRGRFPQVTILHGGGAGATPYQQPLAARLQERGQ